MDASTLHDLPAEAMEALTSQGRIFVSEADFQHAFAWELHRRLPEDAVVRLEQPAVFQAKWYLDVWARHQNLALAVELKYKTCEHPLIIDGENFTLGAHSAEDCNRFDFVKDIVRLEHVVDNRHGTIGYAIMLSNEPRYWDAKHSETDATDRAFRIHEGKVLGGCLDWLPNKKTGKLPSPATMKTKKGPLILRGVYSLNWQKYRSAAPGEGPRGEFRYLVVKVTPTQSGEA